MMTDENISSSLMEDRKGCRGIMGFTVLQQVIIQENIHLCSYFEFSIDGGVDSIKTSFAEDSLLLISIIISIYS